MDSRNTLLISLIGTTLALAGLASGPPKQDERAAQAILEQKCIQCHLPKAAGGSLDLTSAASRLKGGISGPAYVSGKPQNSLLIKRLTASGSVPSMPLGQKGLSTNEQQVLAAWIKRGANLSTPLTAQRHWAWEQPKRPVPPRPTVAGWIKTPIDAFILSTLEREGLQPGKEASKQTLLRRVSFDLTGLPPTVTEINAFLADTSPNAYEHVVDRLFASTHYGERMALPWLDAARYADSNGFQQDGDTFQYIWRDWVVSAMNANMPFDTFTVEQIAGDLLPSATDKQRIATAFNRNHLLNGEGGAIPEEQRNVNLFDRVNTTATTWMGITLACAQCHDHKYDPFSQRDYYQFLSLFNNVPESGVPSGGGQYRIADPAIRYGTQAEIEQIEKLIQLRDTKVKQQGALKQDIDTSARIRMAKTILDQGATRVELSPWMMSSPYTSATYQQAFDTVFSAESDLSVFKPLNRADDGKSSVNIPELSSGNTAIYLIRNMTAATDSIVKLSFGSDDGIRVWVDSQEYIANNTMRGAILGQENLTLALKAGVHTLRVKIVNAAGIGGYAFDYQPLTLPDKSKTLLERFSRNEELQTSEKTIVAQILEPLFHTTNATKFERDIREIDIKLTVLRANLPQVMVMSDAQPRVTRILERGEYLQPRAAVQPAILSLFGGAPIKNRLDFAKWLVRFENPLTARVQVNRYWQHFFGAGLSKTTENFGMLGDKPSHPELLDWLATEFAWDWNVKRIQKLIVMSMTYRQASVCTADNLKKDPGNRFYARSSRLRLPSFVLRDLALATSGLIDLTIGGKPVYPYQPANIWDGLSITKERDFSYPQSTGKDLYRRSIYTFWRRTAAPGNMFDVASRQQCTVNPSYTSTPLHALTTLNDVTWVEAARVLAAQTEKAQPDFSHQLQHLSLQILGRKITRYEQGILQKVHQSSLMYYAKHLEDAERLLSIGQSPKANLRQPYVAALTQVVLALYNLDEAITRE